MHNKVMQQAVHSYANINRTAVVEAEHMTTIYLLWNSRWRTVGLTYNVVVASAPPFLSH